MSNPIDNYIFDRVIIDAQRVIALADQQIGISHPGIKGRFRELLIDNILSPWLPQTVHCATGTVVAFKNIARRKTQEDILLIDQSICPSVLIRPNTQEGVYLRNSVLGRIEVKSSLDSTGFKEFQISCKEFHQVRLDLDKERFDAKRAKLMEINMLFAFQSSVRKETILSWITPVTDGSISAVCVLDQGFWKWNSQLRWDQYICQSSATKAERLAAFVGLVSNTAFHQHISAQGRDRLASLESGVGQHFNYWRML